MSKACWAATVAAMHRAFTEMQTTGLPYSPPVAVARSGSRHAGARWLIQGKSAHPATSPQPCPQHAVHMRSFGSHMAQVSIPDCCCHVCMCRLSNDRRIDI